MSKIPLLVLNYFNNYIGNFSKSKNKAKYGIGGTILFVSAILFVFLFVSMAISTMETTLLYLKTPELTEEEIIQFIQLPLYVSSGMMMMFMLLLTITKATSSKRNSDDDLLLSLPVKKSEIIISRILFNYVFDLLMLLSTLLPSFVVYYVMIPSVYKPDLLYFLRFSYLLLLIPMLTNAIGTLIGTLFELIIRRFAKANAIRSIITVLMLVIFLIGYYALQFYFELFAKTSTNFQMSDILILKIIVDFVLGNNLILYGLIITFVCLIPFAICVLLSSIALGKHTKARNSKKKELVYSNSTVSSTLLAQEIGRYFGSSVYVMNTLFGGIILIILSFAYLIIGESFITDKIMTLAPENAMLVNLLDNAPFVIIAMAIVVISTIDISASSISFEGKNLWIVKAHPVSYKDVFKSKTLCNFYIALTCALVSGLFFGIRFIIDDGLMGILYTTLYIALTTSFAYIVSTSGLLINLYFPKLDWQSETEIIKQSLSVGVALAVGMILAVICVLPTLLLTLFTTGYIPLIGLGCSIVITIILAIISKVLLNTIGKKLYSKI